GETNIRFMDYRKFAYLFSGILIVAGVVSLISHGGPRLGVDFTGGTLIQVALDPHQPAARVRAALSGTGGGKIELQSIGEEGGYLLRLPQSEEKAEAFPAIKDALEKHIPGVSVELRREETVGPRIGRELRSKVIWAVLWALAGILVYVGWRYEFLFAVGAVIALFHDVFITLGILSILNTEITLTVFAALLTIAGYSINDTIVVFDRIREQTKLLRREPLVKVMNLSINQTLSRTVLTGVTTLFTAGALLFLGGEVIHDFALTMCIGVGFGTFSSVYVASALALDLRGPRETRMRK
ncbi:MAG: protein translocase subunit SecF, partial [Candidatus Eisenbacteria bacterium]